MHQSESASNFIRNSNRFPLTGRGDVNTYSIFSELYLKNTSPQGRAGFIVPTGIATDDTNKHYFAELVESNRLVSLFDFENRKALFPGVHRSYKFCLLTLSGDSLSPKQGASFGFFLLDPLDLSSNLRVFGLTREDFLNINPNTKTCPIFRTSVDAELTTKIYRRVPVLVNEVTGQNPWGISFMRMFDMSNDSHLFRTGEKLGKDGFIQKGNRFVKVDDIWLPLFESKMMSIFTHRHNSFAKANLGNNSQLTRPQKEELKTSTFLTLPRYWVQKKEIDKRSEKNWFIGFRNVARTTDVRTAIFSVIPKSAVGNSLPLLFSELNAIQKILLVGMMSSLPFDFVVRQKVGGVNMNFIYILQFAVLKPLSSKIIVERVCSIVTELTYTAWDIKAFADDLWREANEDLRQAIQKQWASNQAETGGHDWQLPEWRDAYPEIAWERAPGCPLPPFKWDDDRRARLQAELDAYYAKLYGLTRDELRYILDPQEVYGADFPGETFRVLKEKEMRKYGEYRTRRLVLEAYDELEVVDTVYA